MDRVVLKMFHESVATLFPFMQNHCSGITALFHEPDVASILPVMRTEEAIQNNNIPIKAFKKDSSSFRVD
jgi:hypothetical protein